MSVHRYELRGGSVRYRVSWRDPDRPGKQKSKSFERKKDADKFDSSVKVKLATGEPIDERSDRLMTVRELIAEWRKLEAAPRLAASTLSHYDSLIKHLNSHIGDTAIRSLDAAKVLALRADLEADKVPDYTRARALKLLRQILNFGVLAGRLNGNPADVLRARGALPNQQRTTDVHVLSVKQLEVVRASLLARRTEHAKRDAVYFSVLAYAGLRPAEAQALAAKHVDVKVKTIRVERQNRKGDPTGPVKTARAKRTVKSLPGPLVADLKTWVKDLGPEDLLFPGVAGRAWTTTETANWARRAWASTAPEGTTPYDARHSCASLLLRSGLGVAATAQQMGHSVEMLTRTYAHVLEAYEGSDPLDIEAEIKAQRSRARRA